MRGRSPKSDSLVSSYAYDDRDLDNDHRRRGRSDKPLLYRMHDKNGRGREAGRHTYLRTAMDDIVDRLRAHLKGHEMVGSENCREAQSWRDAATEIERLRAALALARLYMGPANLRGRDLLADRRAVDAALEQGAQT